VTDLDNFGPDPLIRLPSPVNRWTLGLAHANLGGSSLPAPDAGGDTWLPLFAQVCHQVNQEYFRFVLDVLGEADEPLLIPVADLDADVPAGLDDHHLDRKLVLLLAHGSDGELTIRLPRTGRTCALGDGVVAVYPAFERAVVDVGSSTAGTLVIAHAIGPSFV
jgi:hypothetical protein